ncbi:MAG: hypothetical protein MJZ58_01055 [Paludibacteraceae bacterium]|nr:hypothetical protein [Paludibacteraceae bacterium]
MKKVFLLSILLSLFSAVTTAETRYYFIREHNLPPDAQCVDLRPGNGQTQWNLKNIYVNEESNYFLCQKQADSWWQVVVETAKNKKVNLSEIDATWYVKLKLRRTVNYTLTLVLVGKGVANGYAISTAAVPADGQWKVLTIPLTEFGITPDFQNEYSGPLVQIHSDLGYAGDEIGIDYCYLTNDPTNEDPGSVQAPKRYYLITNKNTPLSTLPYQVVDYSTQIDVRALGWMQWSYVPFPCYSLDKDTAVIEQVQTTAPISLADVNDDWALIGQVKTSVKGEFAVNLFLPDGTGYTDTVSTEDWNRDGKTWNRFCLKLNNMSKGEYKGTTHVLCSFASQMATAGEWAMGSLMLTNDLAASDPNPVIPGDPAQEKRIYLLNDGTPLPENMNCTDYRLGQTNFLRADYGNNTTRKSSDGFLTLLPTNGWWSADISAQQAVDLTTVDNTWTLHTRIRTTSAYRPINIIFYKAGNAQLSKYQLTEALLPVASNGEWFTFDIPMKDILAGTAALINYTSRIFSFHSDNGGTAGVEVSMEYLYFSHEGESRPDPQPGPQPEVEPEIVIIPPTGWLNRKQTPNLNKIWYNGQIVIPKGTSLFNLLGQKIR